MFLWALGTVPCPVALCWENTHVRDAHFHPGRPCLSGNTDKEAAGACACSPAALSSTALTTGQRPLLAQAHARSESDLCPPVMPGVKGDRGSSVS